MVPPPLPPCTKLTCNIYSECQRLPDMATQLCVGGRGGSLSSRLQLAITCIVEITCNLHCIHRKRQTILIQNVVQDDTTNVSLMFVCKWNRGSGIIRYNINHFYLQLFFERASLCSWATFMLASWFAYLPRFFDNFVEQFMRAICGPGPHGCILVH